MGKNELKIHNSILYIYLYQGLDELKTEKKLNFGSSGSRGLHPGTFSDGFGEFSTWKKKMNNDDAMINGKLLKLN